MSSITLANSHWTLYRHNQGPALTFPQLCPIPLKKKKKMNKLFMTTTELHLYFCINDIGLVRPIRIYPQELKVGAKKSMAKLGILRWEHEWSVDCVLSSRNICKHQGSCIPTHKYFTSAGSSTRSSEIDNFGCGEGLVDLDGGIKCISLWQSPPGPSWHLFFWKIKDHTIFVKNVEVNITIEWDIYLVAWLGL